MINTLKVKGKKKGNKGSRENAFSKMNEKVDLVLLNSYNNIYIRNLQAF